MPLFLKDIQTINCRNIDHKTFFHVQLLQVHDVNFPEVPGLWEQGRLVNRKGRPEKLVLRELSMWRAESN